MPNRASKLTSASLPRAPRGGLTREGLVRAAVSLADREGLDAVSIRRVAGELNTRPMTLYTYVASKEDLLRLMGEEVVAEVIVPPPLPNGWRAAITAIAVRSHETFKRHPWLPVVAAHRPHLGFNALRHAEQLLAALAELDLPRGDAWHILYALNDLTLGHALRITHASENGDSYPRFDPEQFPHLAAALRRPPRRRDDSTFRAALELLLSGIEQRHAWR
jgi:AcrR family transcriptional regulator